MDAAEFDEDEFFRAIAASGARALLIGRRALIALGYPVNTGDYDFWLHADDIETLNRAVGPFGFAPNRSAVEARQRGRYVLENDERVDVLVAAVVPTVEGERISFEDLWSRRKIHQTGPGVAVSFSQRPKDSEDLRVLEVLLAREEGK